jgi:F-type H+-transporting ATPase subunit b
MVYLSNLFLVLADTIEGSGGLFDFNATLPLMALQVILLTFLLNIFFYAPVTEVLDKRNTYITESLKSATSMLDEAELLSTEYEEKLLAARKEAQVILVSAKEEAQSTVRLEVEQAQKDTAKLIDESTKQLNIQKDLALTTLQGQVDTLSEQIKAKILAG